jgi:hypothetical protein
MTAASWALAPVFAVILVGFLLRRTGLVGAVHWESVDHVCYFVLFPAIIFKEIAAADFANVPVARMALAMILAVMTMAALLLVFRRSISGAFRIDSPQFTSLFQGAIRWHTFIAFAIIPIHFGHEALALGAVSAAAMTPVLNIVCVWVLSMHASRQGAQFRDILQSLATNPFVVSSLGGVAWQLSGFSLPSVTLQALDMIGKGALGLALLTVGAGLRTSEAMSSFAPVAAATALKLVVMPVIMALWLTVFGVSGLAAAVAMLCSAVPTGSGAYVLAKRLGGDPALVANVLTLQVIFAAFTIPVVLTIWGNP